MAAIGPNPNLSTNSPEPALSAKTKETPEKETAAKVNAVARNKVVNHFKTLQVKQTVQYVGFYLKIKEALKGENVGFNDNTLEIDLKRPFSEAKSLINRYPQLKEYFNFLDKSNVGSCRLHDIWYVWEDGHIEK